MRLRSIIGGVLLAGLLAGCAGAPPTRFLICQARPSAIESKSWDLHDPFPDESLGPDTITRPREFMVPRSDEQKSTEIRQLQVSQMEKMGRNPVMVGRSPLWGSSNQVANIDPPEKKIPAGWAWFEPAYRGFWR